MIQIKTERPMGSRAMALGFSLALVIAGLLLTSRPARVATTFTVNSTGDAEDVNPGDGACTVNDIPGFAGCTLRAAIQEANATRGKGHHQVQHRWRERGQDHLPNITAAAHDRHGDPRRLHPKWS